LQGGSNPGKVPNLPRKGVGRVCPRKKVGKPNVLWVLSGGGFVLKRTWFKKSRIRKGGTMQSPSMHQKEIGVDPWGCGCSFGIIKEESTCATALLHVSRTCGSKVCGAGVNGICSWRGLLLALELAVIHRNYGGGANSTRGRDVGKRVGRTRNSPPITPRVVGKVTPGRWPFVPRGRKG